MLNIQKQTPKTQGLNTCVGFQMFSTPVEEKSSHGRADFWGSCGIGTEQALGFLLCILRGISAMMGFTDGIYDW